MIASASCGLELKKWRICVVSVLSACARLRMEFAFSVTVDAIFASRTVFSASSLCAVTSAFLDLLVGEDDAELLSRLPNALSEPFRLIEAVQLRSGLAEQRDLDRGPLRAVGDVLQSVRDLPEDVAGILALQLIDADPDGIERLDLSLRTDLCLAHRNGEARQSAFELFLRYSTLLSREPIFLKLLRRDAERGCSLTDRRGILESLLDLLRERADRERRDQPFDRDLRRLERALDVSRQPARDRLGLVRARFELGGIEAQCDTKRAD
jgi:hypothetical protein